MRYALYLVLFFTAVNSRVFAQTDSAVLSHTESSLSGYFSNHPVEKVYLHSDKQYYIPGDTVWFKAYTVLGPAHQLSPLSGVLYCELISPGDSVINRHTLKLLVGLGWGDFALPRSIKPGNYHLRAYTNWMRNAGPEYFYNQEIKIGGIQQLTPSPAGQPGTLSAAQTTINNPDVQFFPEGGQLVTGIRSKIAVKCINSNGLGLDITGVIIDNDGNEVADFATRHLGMGVFALLPQPAKTYKARITTTGNQPFTIDLPPAQDEGFTLAVNTSPADSIYIKVAVNDKLFQTKQNSAFYLMGQSGGRVFYTAAGKLIVPVFTAAVAKKRFPGGIVQFTLFSQGGQPLNERIIFIQNDAALNLSLTSSAQTYTTRQKVKIDLGIQGSDKQYPIGSFSAAVINESRVPANENDQSTIFNNLLLTSDIKGYIERPNYYFDKVTDQTRADLDILMLTQGYRRFDWKQVLANTDQPVAYQPETTLELTGSIKTLSGKPVPNGKIILTSPKENYLVDTVADLNGNFKFKRLNLSDTAKIILRARKQSNGSNVAIYVQKPGYPPIIKPSVNTDTTAALSPEMIKNISDYQARIKQDSLKHGRHLKEIEVKDKRGPKPDRFNGYGTSMEYDADMTRLRREFNRLGDALPSIIPAANYIDGKGITYEHDRARLIIDGLPHKADDINLYDPRELESVRMVSATNIRLAQLIVTTKRYAGTDTASTVLKEVKITANKIRKEPDLSRSQSIHPGGADQVIMGDKLGNCANLSDCLQGKAYGISFGSNGAPSNNRRPSLNGTGSMSVIVDGNILDGSHLNDIVVSDIYSIEILRSVAAYSIYGNSIAGGGALVITMKHGGEASTYTTSVDPAGLITYPFKGFYIARQFYSSKYETSESSTQGADLRSTIYWNPNIITGKDGKASFEYYNADTKGTYRVVVEGIDDNGNIGRQVYTYTVQ